MAYKLIKNPQHYQGTAAELAAMTAGEKALIIEGSTYWVWDSKIGYVFAAGDWKVVA